MRHLGPVAALLTGSAFLFFAGGMNALLLPLRGAQEGFQPFALGLLGAGWAFGFVSGCLVVSKLVERVGHIRAFSVMSALAAMAILTSLLLMTPLAWVPLRAVSGFAFAGAMMIMESWLNQATGREDRGKVFGVYQMVNLTASTAGQLTLTLGDTRGFVFFIIGAMVYCAALVPTATSTHAPRPLVGTKLNIKELWVNSPVAVVAVVLIGMSNSSFGTLGAVYGSAIGLPVSAIALFVALPVLAGAVIQIPIGALSDRLDRRIVLIGVATLGIVADLLFLTMSDRPAVFLIAFALMFGMSIFTMYPIAVAHANDHAAPGAFVRTSGGLLLLFGSGSMVGPVAAGLAMEVAPEGLFAVTLVAHVLVVIYAGYRMTKRAAVDPTKRKEFVPAQSPRNTPQTSVLAEPAANDPSKPGVA